MEPKVMLKMTVRELREALKETRTVLIPVGVCEQHGYHLPLGTDVHNAEQICLRVAQRFPCVIAPTIAYSFSGGSLPGTININPAVLSLLISEAALSLYTQGFRRVCIVMGHGGSELNAHIKEAMRIFLWEHQELEDLQLVVLPLWEFSPTMLEWFEKGDYHSGAVETSLMLFWAPDEVRDEIVLDEPEIARMMQEDPDFYQELRVRSESPYEIPHTRQKDQIEVGVMGFPEKASRELGQKICEEVVTKIAKELQSMEEQSGSCYRVRIPQERMKLLRDRMPK